MKQHVPRFVPASWLLTLLLCSNSTSAQLPAFPGAQGFGRFATGGRGGSVYFVTNLNDSGPGSFRDAVSVSGRTVIFRVGGVIAYTGSRYNVAPNITVAGQTAPGDGVTLYGDGIGYNGSHNTITRFIRYRMGINGESDKDAIAIDTGRNMIFDHITASWGRDETFSISGSNPTNITIQSSIISQGLQGHSAGGLVQTDGGVSILRTLYIDNDTRNPKVKGVNEYVNNVICNWETIGYNMGGDSAGESFVNVFNNYFMRGPASSGSAIPRRPSHRAVTRSKRRIARFIPRVPIYPDQDRPLKFRLRLTARAPQPQGIPNHGDGRQAHRERRDQRTQEPPRGGIQYARSQRNT